MTLQSEHTLELVRMHTPASALRMEDFGKLAGYAAVFDTPTIINNWEGNFTESFAKGAFRNTLRAQDGKIKLLYDHGMDPSIGNKPLGRIDVLREDDHGLYLEADLLDRPYAQDIAAAVGAGALDGMSFRFSVVREEWKENLRTVKEAKLHEVSVVTFPAYEATQVGVRGAPAYTMLRDQLISAADSGTETDTPPESGHLSEEQVALLEYIRSHYDR